MKLLNDFGCFNKQNYKIEGNRILNHNYLHHRKMILKPNLNEVA